MVASKISNMYRFCVREKFMHTKLQNFTLTVSLVKFLNKNVTDVLHKSISHVTNR